MTAWQARVRAAFGAADSYEAHAVAQAEAADWLADRIAAAAPHGRVLEIGCGTGMLAARALARCGTGDWLMTDLSPAMVARCRARFGKHGGVRFGVLDGSAPDLPDEASFDLVCSNLAAQWFEDLPAALAAQLRLVRAGGWLMLTTLLDGTFAEWRRAVTEAGGTAGTPDYPTRQCLAGLRIDGSSLTVEQRRIPVHHASARDFLQALKAIGAATARPGHRPLSPAVLRAAMQRFTDAGAVASYEVALIAIRSDRRSP